MDQLLERQKLMKKFFSTLLGCISYWAYKPTSAVLADSPGVFTSDKNLNLNTIDFFKCDVIDDSIGDSLRQPILYSFLLDKLPGHKLFCDPETINYKKVNKSVLNTIKFLIEDNNRKEVNSKQKALTFTLQLIKIRNNKWAVKVLKLIVIALVKNTTLVQKTLLVR